MLVVVVVVAVVLVEVVVEITILIENASARPSHPQISGPADRGAQSVLGVYA